MDVRKAEPFNLKLYLYNSEKGTVLGRDRVSWGKFTLSRLRICLRNSNSNEGLKITPKWWWKVNWTSNDFQTFWIGKHLKWFRERRSVSIHLNRLKEGILFMRTHNTKKKKKSFLRDPCLLNSGHADEILA